MKFEEISDFEINSKVGLHLGHRVSREHECIETGSCLILTKNYGERIEFNPCNNPNDAWPIIVENKIDLAHTVSGKANCAVFKADERGIYREFYTTTNENPLRAAMICFLLKMEEEA